MDDGIGLSLPVPRRFVSNMWWIVAMSASLIATQPTLASTQQPSIFSQLADEVTDKMLAGHAIADKVADGRHPRIVVGDVLNNTDDDDIRVDDIFAEMRDRIVAAATTRLFAPGELKVDYIIAPTLTSVRSGRGHCFTLQVTLTTVAGEFAESQSATRCQR